MGARPRRSAWVSRFAWAPGYRLQASATSARPVEQATTGHIGLPRGAKFVQRELRRPTLAGSRAQVRLERTSAGIAASGGRPDFAVVAKSTRGGTIRSFGCTFATAASIGSAMSSQLWLGL